MVGVGVEELSGESGLVAGSPFGAVEGDAELQEKERECEDCTEGRMVGIEGRAAGFEIEIAGCEMAGFVPSLCLLKGAGEHGGAHGEQESYGEVGPGHKNRIQNSGVRIQSAWLASKMRMSFVSWQ